MRLDRLRKFYKFCIDAGEPNILIAELLTKRWEIRIALFSTMLKDAPPKRYSPGEYGNDMIYCNPGLWIKE